MHIVIKSTQEQQRSLAPFFLNTESAISWIESSNHIPDADVYFDASYETDGFAFSMIVGKPIFINAVIDFGKSIPQNCIRYNGWSGFLNQSTIEIASSNMTLLEQGKNILSNLKKKVIIAPDLPGMVSARVVSMIINEAYFGLGDGISTKKDIDTAMKLGTNYPFGPFEWSEMIGIKNVYSLLLKLNESSPRYAIAPAMIKDL